MARVTWNSTGNWIIPADWSTGALPFPDDDVFVQGGTLTVSSNVGAVNSITISSGPYLKIINGGALTTSSFENDGIVDIDQINGSTSSDNPSLTINGLLSNNGIIDLGVQDQSTSVVPTITIQQLDNKGFLEVVGGEVSRPQLTVIGSAVVNGVVEVWAGSATFEGAITGTGSIYLGISTGDSFLNLAGSWNSGRITIFDQNRIARITLASGTDPGARIDNFRGLSSIDFSAVNYAAGDYITLRRVRLVAGFVSVRDAAGKIVASMRVGNSSNYPDGYTPSGFTVGDDGTGHLLLFAAPGHTETIDDFNGDGRSDLLWSNPTSGTLTDWSIPNGVKQNTYTIGAPGGGYKYIRTGDFNGDGTADLLLRNASTGALVDWDLSNGVRSSAHVIATLTADWAVKGAIDFDGDGTSDLLLYNTQTGTIKDWIIRNDKLVASNVLGSETPGNGWGIIGTGDFDGNGMSDVLLRNSTTGALESWETVDGKRSLVASVGTQPADTTIVGVGDFDMDGIDDLLLQTSGRELEYWAMRNGQALHDPVDLGIAVPSGFNVVSPGTFGTRTDVMIYNPKTGQIDVGLSSQSSHTHITSWTVVGTQSPTAATLLV